MIKPTYSKSTAQGRLHDTISDLVAARRRRKGKNRRVPASRSAHLEGRKQGIGGEKQTKKVIQREMKRNVELERKQKTKSRYS